MREVLTSVSFEKPGTPEELVDDLIHFGIKGMRWGVRKREETSSRKPTKSETSGWSNKKRTRVEKRAKRHEIQARKAQTEIDKIKDNPSKWRTIQNNRNNRIKELEKYRNRELKAAKDLRAGHLTDFQKKVIIGSSVTAGILATYGTYRLVETGTARQFLTRNTPFVKNDLLNRKMSSDAIMREVVKPINPNYGGLGTKMNCRRCTFAYEMRRRGFDVKATNSVEGSGQTIAGLLNAVDPSSHLRTGVHAVNRDLQKSGHPVEIASRISQLGKESIDINRGVFAVKPDGTIFNAGSNASNNIFQAIGKHSEGARGELGVGWNMGGAHSMAWEIIGGKPHIFDTQTGKVYSSIAAFDKDMGKVINQAGITRLDNIPLNENFLRKWVFNVK